MLPRRAAVVAGLLYALPLATPQASTCEFVTVTGGASPGSYALLQSDGEGDVYTNGETGAALLYTTSSIRRGRRRRLEGRGRLHLADNTAANSLSGAEGLVVEETIGWRRQQQGQEGGAKRRRRSLAECASGFWINLPGGVDSGVASSSAGADPPSLDGDVGYPVYVAPDCADHPVNITAEWFSIGCATCELEPASPTLSFECDEDFDNGDIATPAPTAILTPDETPAPSADIQTVQIESLPPTAAPTTPAPQGLETPAPGTESLLPEQVETLPPTAAPTTPAPQSLETPAPSTESLPEQVETLPPTGVSTTTPAPERSETPAPSAEGGGLSAVPAVGGGVTPSPESGSAVSDGEGSAGTSGAERVGSGALGWLVAVAALLSLFSSS